VPVQNWNSIASSSDGTHLAATSKNNSQQAGRLYTSADSGVTWTLQNGAGTPMWSTVASSADGRSLVAAVQSGQIYNPKSATTPGTSGSVSGSQFEEIELQYVGNETFYVVGNEGLVLVR
jgi:cytoskeletal protein RodZ